MKKAALLTGLILGCVSPAVAQRGPESGPGFGPAYIAPPAPTLPPRRSPGYTRLMSELRDLRETALALRESDGGTLSSEHSDLIQAQIDAAYRRFHDARRQRRTPRS